MSPALKMISTASRQLGYRADAILDDYVFSDFLSTDESVTRRASLAVFAQTPPSYRSAAFGVVERGPLGAEATVRDYRALGAPLFFVLEGNRVSAWQVFAEGPPRLLDNVNVSDVGELFQSRKEVWSPDSIRRAKSIGRVNSQYQLDFVDAGLIPAIEGQIHSKLDRLLGDALAAAQPITEDSDQRSIFRGIFRLLAAKVLTDRNNQVASEWNENSVASVLRGIGNYYGLNSSDVASFRSVAGALSRSWDVLRRGVDVANISADDLAFVYENTLVTPETRRTFGTHSTPRHVAEYVVERLGLWRFETEPPTVYEPFAGAGVFLVSALRHLREALPHGWTDRRRHDLLTKRLSGSELDAFACEVANLSLILADYPNRNGWQIENVDLLTSGVLSERLKGKDVILCNPPFEVLSENERDSYPEIAAISGSKAEAVLTLALRASPKALGFVLPRAFLMDRAYREARRSVETSFRDVELVSLPDGVFKFSSWETSLLIARDPFERDEAQALRSSEVDDKDRHAVALRGLPSRTREETRSSIEGVGRLWIPPLSSLWHRLHAAPRLGDFVEGHWGLRWLDRRQGSAERDRQGPDAALGLLKAKDLKQFFVGRPTWIDVAPSHLYGGGSLPWSRPKILCNAARLSRGNWRLAATVDLTGLYASQQFVGLWPKVPSDGTDMDALVAILNSPLANAFMADHSTEKRFRIATLLQIPLPKHIPTELGNLVREYAQALQSRDYALGIDHLLASLVDQIDSLVLEAYDLPPREVRSLLASFSAGRRPLAHGWASWNVSQSDPALTLREVRSDWLSRARSGWLRRELTPVSRDDADAVARNLP